MMEYREVPLNKDCPAEAAQWIVDKMDMDTYVFIPPPRARSRGLSACRTANSSSMTDGTSVESSFSIC